MRKKGGLKTDILNKLHLSRGLGGRSKIIKKQDKFINEYIHTGVVLKPFHKKRSQKVFGSITAVIGILLIISKVLLYNNYKWLAFLGIVVALIGVVYYLEAVA